MSSQMEKDRISSAEVDTDASSEEQAPKPVQRRKKKGSKTARRQKKSSGPLDQLPLGDSLGGDQVGNTVGGVTNTLGSVAGGALDKQGGDGGGKSDTLRLRLDLNLDIEIQLKARIHGDLELALL